VSWSDDPAAAYYDPGYPGEHVVLQDSFIDGARCLLDLELIFDVWAFHTQLGDIEYLAKKLPDLTIVVDHCGGPLGVGRYQGRRSEVFADWSRAIRQLAAYPNVHIKLSGLGIRRLGFTFPDGQAKSSDELVEAWKPYIHTCIDAFGPGRSLFGSNYPVDAAVASYRVLLNGYKKLLSDLSDDESGAVFAGNARRLYKIA
jgi:predicted TIM-barrel fold metal-dependent hydrolase